MISILSEPMIKVENGPELRLSLDSSNKFPLTVNCIANDTSLLGKAIFKVFSKLNPEVKVGDSEVKVIANTSGMRLQRHKYILWGCQLTNTENMNLNLIEARCLTGPNSYGVLNKKPGSMFDIRLLIPWAFDIPKNKEYSIPFCLIPGDQDLQFIQMKDMLSQNNVTVVDPSSPIEEQLDIMSKSMVVLTSSITHFIISDGMGSPVYPFFSRGNKATFRNLLSDYFSGSGRNNVDMLDFARSISISAMPPAPGNIYDLDSALASCPIEISQDTIKSIKEYFNEA